MMFIRLYYILCLFPVWTLAAPQIQSWQTSNNTEVYFVQTRQLPIIDVQVVFDAGSMRDPGGKQGLSMITNGLLSQSAGGYTADEISFEFERHGAEFDARSGYDSASVSLRSLSDVARRGPALENLQRLISSPDFPDEALQRQKNQLLVAIQGKQQSPATIANELFQSEVYRQHPYAFPVEGTPASLANINRDDVIKHHREFYSAANAIVTIVGDLGRSEAEQIAESLTRNLPPGKKPETVPPVSPLNSGGIVKVSHPSSQVHIIMGQPGIRYGDPDYFPLYVGNHILGGGGLVSRLFAEVREKRGLSYSASSYFSPRKDVGPFIAGVQTREDQEEEARTVMLETITEFVDKGPTVDELRAAKKNITGGFPLRIDSNAKISGYVAVIGFYSLPLDYLVTFNEKVNEVTAEQIKDAFQRRIHPDKFVTVLVGPLLEESSGSGN